MPPAPTRAGTWVVRCSTRRGPTDRATALGGAPATPEVHARISEMSYADWRVERMGGALVETWTGGRQQTRGEQTGGMATQADWNRGAPSGLVHQMQRQRRTSRCADSAAHPVSNAYLTSRARSASLRCECCARSRGAEPLRGHPAGAGRVWTARPVPTAGRSGGPRRRSWPTRLSEQDREALIRSTGACAARRHRLTKPRLGTISITRQMPCRDDSPPPGDEMHNIRTSTPRAPAGSGRRLNAVDAWTGPWRTWPQAPALPGTGLHPGHRPGLRLAAKCSRPAQRRQDGARSSASLVER